MKKLYIWLLLLMVNIGYAQKETAEDIELSAWKGLLEENRITQFEFNQKAARIKYQRQQKENAGFATIKSMEIDGPGGTASISGIVNAVDPENVFISVCESYINNCIYGVNTDALGAYSIGGLPAGTYYVRSYSDNDDYVNAMWSAAGTEFCHNNCQTDADNQVVLADAEARVGVNLDLVVGASISGTVVSGPTALENVYVSIRNTTNTGYYGGWQTNASGDYAIKGLPAGDYYLQVQNTQDIYIDAMWSNIGTVQCYDCIPDGDSTLSMALGDASTGVDFNLTIGATVTGSISDAVTAAAVETLGVQLYDTTESDVYWFFDAIFDGAGNYTISGIPAGNYVPYLEPKYDVDNLHIPEIYNNISCNACFTLLANGAGDAVNLVNGDTVVNIDFELELGARISGFIVDGLNLVQPMEKFAYILLFNDSNRLIDSRFLYGTDYDPLTTGSYTVGGLLPGMYFVQGGDGGHQFYQRELFDNLPCPWSGCDRGGGGDAVVLGNREQRLGVNFLLNYGGKISGTVTDASTGLPADQTYSEYVQFYDSNGTVAGGAVIEEDGSYISARALPPGDYSVRTGSMFNGVFISPYVMQKYDPAGNIDCPGVTCDLSAGNVTVEAFDPLQADPEVAATVTGIDFALSPAYSFSGTITELGSADPIPDVHVLVYNELGVFANWATTDASGDFTVHGLPAGRYYALTNNGSNLPFMGLYQTESGGWIDILFNGIPCPGSACDVTDGDPIVLGPVPPDASNKGAVSYDFTMVSGGSITGQVRNFESQLPASAVEVRVYNAAGDFYGSYVTDSNGYYLTVGFPPGNYYLVTVNNGALIDVKYGGEYCFDESCNELDATPIEILGQQSVVGADFELRPDYIYKNGLD